MRDDEEWYQDAKGYILDASVALDHKIADHVAIGNAIGALYSAIEVLERQEEVIEDEAERKRMMEGDDESIST